MTAARAAWCSLVLSWGQRGLSLRCTSQVVTPVQCLWTGRLPTRAPGSPLRLSGDRGTFCPRSAGESRHRALAKRVGGIYSRESLSLWQVSYLSEETKLSVLSQPADMHLLGRGSNSPVSQIPHSFCSYPPFIALCPRWHQHSQYFSGGCCPPIAWPYDLAREDVSPVFAWRCSCTT